MTDNISDKDKKDWDLFINSNEKLPNKDFQNKDKKTLKIGSIDLHGYTLEGANKKMSEYINECYENNISVINVITGKGLRSKNKENPYSSTDLGILKHSVPNYIKNNTDSEYVLHCSNSGYPSSKLMNSQAAGYVFITNVSGSPKTMRLEMRWDNNFSGDMSKKDITVP